MIWLFLASHITAAAYAFISKGDLTLALVFLGNSAGSAAIVGVATWKRVQHKRRQMPTTGVVALFPVPVAQAA